MCARNVDAIKKSQTGFTLVELVITIVIIGIVASGLISAIAKITQHSADPMLSRQALAIAESYLDEIMARSFVDPDIGAGAGSCNSSGSESRTTFDNVCDYNGLSNSPAQDSSGTTYTGYTASVSVTAAALNTITAVSDNALRVTVTVTDPKGQQTRLSGYRTRY